MLRVLSLADGSSHDLWRGEFGCWSPAGDQIASGSSDGVRVGPAAGGPSRLLVPRGDQDSGPYLCTWARDARTIYYLFRDASGWSIRSFPVSGGRTRVLVTFDDPERQPSRYGFATDGRRCYLTLGRRESDVWVAELKRQ